MRKRIRDNWHILIILVMVFSLSLFSWVSTAMDIRNIKSVILSADEIEEENSRVGFERIDHKIDCIYSNWKEFGQTSLSKIDVIITYFLTGEIASQYVIDGEGKWLFFKGTTDGSPLEDYEGTNRYSEQYIEEIANSVLLTQHEIESKGIKMSILVAPNKENIYSENMPSSYNLAEVTRTEELIEAIKHKGGKIVYPKEELKYYHEDYQLYYYYDTHWNQLGAYVGVRNALIPWDISVPDISSLSIHSSELKKRYHYCAEDDLAKMIGLRFVFSDETEYEIDGFEKIDWDVFSEEQKEGLSHFYNKYAENDARILLVGDSYRTSMIPSLMEQFSNVYVVHRGYYKNSMIEEVNPDYLLCEYVERLSGEMGNIEFILKR